MKFISISIILLVFVCCINAQTLPVTGEHVTNKYALSKAYSGYYGDINAAATYRANWLGFPGAPEYIRANFDMPMPYNCGLGLSVLNYKVGIFSDFNIDGTYALNIPVQRQHLIYFGLTLHYLRSTVDYGKAKYSDISDQFISQNLLTRSANRLNSSVNIAYNWKDLYAGITLSNLFHKGLKNGNLEYPIYREFKLFSNYRYYINTNWEVEGFFILSTFKNNKVNYDITAIGIYDEDMWFGLNWKRPVNFALIFGTHLSDNIYINYSAGITGEPGFSNTMGTHEITLGYRIRSKGAWISDNRRSNGLIEKIIKFFGGLFGGGRR